MLKTSCADRCSSFLGRREAPHVDRLYCHQKVTGERLEPRVKVAFNTPSALYLLTLWMPLLIAVPAEFRVIMKSRCEFK